MARHNKTAVIRYHFSDDPPPEGPVKVTREDGHLVLTIWSGLTKEERKLAVREALDAEHRRQREFVLVPAMLAGATVRAAVHHHPAVAAGFASAATAGVAGAVIGIAVVTPPAAHVSSPGQPGPVATQPVTRASRRPAPPGARPAAPGRVPGIPRQAAVAAMHSRPEPGSAPTGGPSPSPDPSPTVTSAPPSPTRSSPSGRHPGPHCVLKVGLLGVVVKVCS